MSVDRYALCDALLAEGYEFIRYDDLKFKKPMTSHYDEDGSCIDGGTDTPKRIRRLAQKLLKFGAWEVAPVNELCFNGTYEESPPSSAEEAAAFLTYRDMPTWGLKLHTNGSNDWVWRAFTARCCESQGKRFRYSNERVGKSALARHLSHQVAENTLLRGFMCSIPRDDRQRIMLPARQIRTLPSSE